MTARINGNAVGEAGPTGPTGPVGPAPAGSANDVVTLLSSGVAQAVSPTALVATLPVATDSVAGVFSAADHLTFTQLANGAGAETKRAVRAASNLALAATRSGNIYTATGLVVLTKALIDSGWSTGPALAVNDRLLLTAQSSSVDNGIVRITSLGVFGVTAWTLVRDTDADSSAEVQAGQIVPVGEGTSANRRWELAVPSDPAPVLNTDAMTFQLAATADISVATPQPLGTAAAGTSNKVSAGDHVHENPTASQISDSTAAGRALLTAADAAAQRAALGVPAFAIGHSWERPDPVTAGAGAQFLSSDDLTLALSTGLAASPGVVATGWTRPLAQSVGPDRAGLTMGRVFAGPVDLSAYTIGATTLAVLFYWSGSVPVIGASEVAGVGDSNGNVRGIHVALVQNGGNVDLGVYGNGAGATLLSSISTSAGLHAFVVAPVNVAGTHKWRWSLDGSAVTDTPMGANYLAPNSSDSLGAWCRADGVLPLSGQGIDLMLFGSLLSNADILALATLPGTPTYALPESASTGAAPIRAQANRYDLALPTVLVARGLTAPLTVSGVTKVAF